MTCFPFTSEDELTFTITIDTPDGEEWLEFKQNKQKIYTPE